VSFNLIYTKRAVKDVRKLEEKTKKRIGRALLRFSEDPFAFAEKLTENKIGSYRFRIGDYRAVFDLDGKNIVVLRIGHRRDIYRQF
jgi:mRNA interferase RelE/StbE